MPVEFRLTKKPPTAQQQTDLILEELVKTAVHIAKRHQKEREKILNTWENARPKFPYQIKKLRGARAVLLTVLLSGEPMGKKKWIWLGHGTKKRFMHVSRDWRSKTKVNWIGSRAGRGRITGLAWPLPGIRARNFDKVVNKKVIKAQVKMTDKAIKRGLKRRRKGKFSSVLNIYG